MNLTIRHLLPASVLVVAGVTLAACTLGTSAQADVRADVKAGQTYGVDLPAPAAQLPSTASGPQTVVLAGGCFWGMEEVYQHVKGVTDVVSGYAGGDSEHANYRDSSSGRYDDAEAVRITYNPAEISYAKILQVYFSAAHDPTQVNRQGPDVGSQYRSEVFAATPAQARVAREYIQQLDAAGVYDAPVATRVSVGEKFFPAEAYHQDYAQKHPDSYYLQVNDAPKVAAVKRRFASLYRSADSQQTASLNR